MSRKTRATTAGVARSRAKYSKRQRFVLKWNGPFCMTAKDRKRVKASLGKGDETQRDIAYFYECRFYGAHPSIAFLGPNRPSANKTSTQARRHT